MCHRGHVMSITRCPVCPCPVYFHRILLYSPLSLNPCLLLHNGQCFIIVPYNRLLLISDISFRSPGALGKIAILESLLGSLELRMYRYPVSPL